MKVVDVSEAAGKLSYLIAEAVAGRHIVLKDGATEVELNPRPTLNLDEDSPELEAELLKAVQGPFREYSRAELDGIVEKLIRDRNK